MKAAIVVIDHDLSFLERLRHQFDDLGLLTQYDYCPIEMRGASLEEVINRCDKDLRKLINDNLVIELVLVDVVIFESEEPPQDRSGLEVAKHIWSFFPEMPIVAITRFHKAYRLLSEISFEPQLHGILLKTFLQSPEFSRKDLTDTVLRAREKMSLTLQKGYDGSSKKLAELEERFQFQSDPRCLYQVLRIGKRDFLVILDSLFPFSEGAVKYLRPGFSGSYIFKVSVRAQSPGEDGSRPQTWVVKISQDKEMLGDELQRSVRLKDRISADLYPELLRTELTVFNKWAALAFALQEDTIVFAEYLNDDQNAVSILELIESALIPFLKSHYGNPVRRHCFIWKTFYEIGERTKAGILNFIDEAQYVGGPRFSRLDETFRRIKDFVRTDGKTEPAIYEFTGNFDSRYIHGDLNSRNILVSNNGKRLVFIDFAKSVQDHYMKDIAKLETDLIFLVMDSASANQTDWSRMELWEAISEMCNKEGMFNSQSMRNCDEPGLNRAWEIIKSLRKGLVSLGTRPDEREYLLALLHYTLQLLSYADVSFQKKVLAIQHVQGIFNRLSAFTS